jgi:hypothetical protein
MGNSRMRRMIIAKERDREIRQAKQRMLATLVTELSRSHEDPAIVAHLQELAVELAKTPDYDAPALVRMMERIEDAMEQAKAR